MIGSPSPADQDQLAFLGQLAQEITHLVLDDPAQGRDLFSRDSPLGSHQLKDHLLLLNRVEPGLPRG